jgi:hypothetical protein
MDGHAIVPTVCTDVHPATDASRMGAHHERVACGTRGHGTRRFVPSGNHREPLAEHTMNADLTAIIAEVRLAHKFYRAHPDPSKRPDYMECECGAMIPTMMCEPWEAFELHRSEMIAARLGIEQYGAGWHRNSFTGELSPDDDSGNNRLFRVRALEPQ